MPLRDVEVARSRLVKMTSAAECTASSASRLSAASDDGRADPMRGAAVAGDRGAMRRTSAGRASRPASCRVVVAEARGRLKNRVHSDDGATVSWSPVLVCDSSCSVMVAAEQARAMTGKWAVLGGWSGWVWVWGNVERPCASADCKGCASAARVSAWTRDGGTGGGGSGGGGGAALLSQRQYYAAATRTPSQVRGLRCASCDAACSPPTSSAHALRDAGRVCDARPSVAPAILATNTSRPQRRRLRRRSRLGVHLLDQCSGNCTTATATHSNGNPALFDPVLLGTAQRLLHGQRVGRLSVLDACTFGN